MTLEWVAKKYHFAFSFTKSILFLKECWALCTTSYSSAFFQAWQYSSVIMNREPGIGRRSPHITLGTFYRLYAMPTYSTVVFSLLVLHNFNFYIYMYIYFKKSLFWGKNTICFSFQIFIWKRKHSQWWPGQSRPGQEQHHVALQLQDFSFPFSLFFFFF